MKRSLPLARRATLLLAGVTVSVATLIAFWPAADPTPATAPPTANAAPLPAPIAPPANLPPPPTGQASSLKLHGVLGHEDGRGTAIIGLPDGRHLLIGTGREVLPGVRLRSLRPDAAVLSDNGHPVELALSTPETPVGPGTVPAPSSPAAAQAREALGYRLGLKAERSGDRVRGYRIAPNASLPLFEKAGLQAGDLVLSINGQMLDGEERLLELPAELAAASAIEIDYERAGQRAKATVER